MTIITGRSADPRDMVTFVVSGGIFNPVAGTCWNQFWTCDGATGSQVVIGSYPITVGGTESQHFCITQDNAGQQEYTSSASWNSSNTSILTVQAGAWLLGRAAAQRMTTPR